MPNIAIPFADGKGVHTTYCANGEYSRLTADLNHLACFIHTLFRHADPGTYISLRVFDQNRDSGAARQIKGVKVNGDLSRVALEAAAVANNWAGVPVVFAPPVATFAGEYSAKEADVANGLAISVELDRGNMDAARATLEGLIGPATLGLRSGGIWIGDDGTAHPKVHLHWLLRQPTRSGTEHSQLKEARYLAATLVGGDTSAAPSCHPLRWPGTWNLKGDQPRLSHVFLLNEDAEVDLGTALARLEEAVERAGLQGVARNRGSIGNGSNGDGTADIDVIRGALAALGNDDLDWERWNQIGMATWRASGGSGEGEEAWIEWSSKSTKHDEEVCRGRWDHFGNSPPTRLGAGSLVWWATQEGWVPPWRQNVVAMEAIGDGPDGVGSDWTQDSNRQALIQEFNHKYMVVNEAGKALIYQPTFDPQMRRWYNVRITAKDFGLLYANRFVAGTDKEGKPTRVGASKVWLEAKDRRQYIGGVVFDPSGNHTTPDQLNLWQGFAVEPQVGSWTLLREHLRTMICGGDEEAYTFILKWAARMFQRPGEQGETAIVMRGGQGCGKGIFARALAYVAGQHGMQIAHSKHLTGNFNAHLRDTVFLFADEAFFAGDKAHTGVLKAIITEPYLTIEAKYQNAVQTPNYLHLIMASNEKWVVPAEMDERRFLVLDVLGDRVGDTAYFSAIQTELDNGGYEALLWDMLSLDLRGFNHRSPPKTTALGEQKKLSSTVMQWWEDVLQRGYVNIPRADGLGHEWAAEITKDMIFESYKDFAKSHSERRLLSRDSLGRFMKHQAGAQSTRTRTDNHARKYYVGSLENARALFCANNKLVIDWDD